MNQHTEEPVRDEENLANIASLSHWKNLFLEGIVNFAKWCCFVEQMVEWNLYFKFCNVENKAILGKQWKRVFLERTSKSMVQESADCAYS